jgi:hypothetical protein
MESAKVFPDESTGGISPDGTGVPGKRERAIEYL